VQVLDAGMVDGQPWFALELIEGGSLAGRLRGGPLPAREAAALVAALADAVDYAHRRGVVHGDLRTGNILLQTTEDRDQKTPSVLCPKIADFGLVRRLGPAGDGSGFEADVYALGAILHETLTGSPPPSDGPLAGSRRRSGVPRDLEMICLKGLHREPARRYGSARELADDLRRFLDGLPVLARGGSAWAWWAGLAVAGLLAVAFAAWCLWPR
jgi:serine/threonine-protein kinase